MGYQGLRSFDQGHPSLEKLMVRKMSLAYSFKFRSWLDKVNVL